MDTNLIEVVYWDDRAQQVISAKVLYRLGLRVADVIAELGLESVYAAGIYGQVCDLTRQLAPGDRVEIYQPLIIDPKESRIRRMKKSRGDS